MASITMNNGAHPQGNLANPGKGSARGLDTGVKFRHAQRGATDGVEAEWPYISLSILVDY